MKRRKPMPVYLDDSDRQKLDRLAGAWGVSLSSAVQRLVRSFDEINLPKQNVFEVAVSIGVEGFKAVSIEKIEELPESKGIYVVTDCLGKALYVGKASGSRGLKGRWLGRWSHHRDEDFQSNNAVWIRYIELPEYSINSAEADLIAKLAPLLNKRGENAARSTDLSYLRNPEWEVPDEFVYS